MKRTKLVDRVLPNYTRGEEIFNMVSHIVGGALGVIALVLCIVSSALKNDSYAIVTSSIYGITLIALYTMSSIYHGLYPKTAKKVMQIIDHCTIYFLIAGTYTPILLCKVRNVSPIVAWTMFGLLWVCVCVAATLTAIDLKKYSKFSMICYIGMGWCAVFAAKAMLEAIAIPGLIYILVGGIAYTIGAILYGIGKKKYPIMHSVFHIFCIIGSALHFIAIYFYVI